jgi:phage terminase large subunit-like protein
MCSGIEEALNKERLEKLWQTYNTDLKTRKKQGCKELHIATRWSTLDLIGRLKSLNENNPRARFIAVPALNENGESNFEYDGGVGFDTAYFRDIQRSMDEISFKCLFQNEPIEREGLLYHDDELRRYLELPVDEPDAVLSIVDTKNKGTDFFVQPVMLQYGEDYYMVDTICNDDANYEVQYARSANLILTNKVEACQFESNNGGDRVALEVAKRVKEAKGYCNITQQFTTQNKETKIIVYAPWVKQHVIFRDKSLYTPKSEYGKFMEMLLSHPILGKPKHDDVPDVLSSFAKWKNRPETPPTVVGRRPF